MKCKYCVLTYKGQENISLEEICGLIKEFEGNWIALSGGEPTLCDNLFEIIKYAKSINKTTFLVTNGIKLSEMDYVKKLQQAGLDGVALSINGFNNETESKIYNYSNVTKLKLKAFENLRNTGIEVSLSATLGRGVNDQEINSLLIKALENNDFVKELRIRGLASVGRHEEYKGYFLSELMSLFANETGIDFDIILKNSLENGRDHSRDYVNFYIYFSIIHGNIKILSNCIKQNFGSQTFFRKIILLLKDLGIMGFAKSLHRIIIKPSSAVKVLSVRLLSWPDISNIDLFEEIDTAHLYNRNEIINVRRAFVLNDNL